MCICNIHTIWHSQLVEIRVIWCNIFELLHLPKAFQHAREIPKGKKQDTFLLDVTGRLRFHVLSLELIASSKTREIVLH